MSPPAHPVETLRRWVRRNLGVALSALRWDVYRSVDLHAQALTMKTLLTLVPALVVLFAVMRLFEGGLARANLDIIERLIGYLSGSEALREQIWSYVSASAIHQASLSTFTVAVLAVTLLSLLSHVETAFNAQFGVLASRSLGRG